MTVEDLEKLKRKLTREFNQNVAAINQTIELMTQAQSSGSKTITTTTTGTPTHEIVTTTLPRAIEAPAATKNQSQVIREIVEATVGQFTVKSIQGQAEAKTGQKIRERAIMDWIYTQKGKTVEVVSPGAGRSPAVYRRLAVADVIWGILASHDGLG
jgi:rhamnose utilization protein RhaD (predicted bifunctional aldolase and dehydrogenase)